jgi:autophagy-related protein 18
MSILNLAFNQQVSHLCGGIEDGYVIYELNPQIEKKIYNDKKGGVGYMKMLNKSNISAIVGGGENPFESPTSISLWDDLKQRESIKIDMVEPVTNVLIDKTKEELLVAILEKRVCMFDFNGKILNTKTTYCNTKGIGTMNYGSDKTVFVTLGTKKGEIALWKTNSDDYKTIEAHASNIDAVAINSQGTMVATASETGTLIKVFSVETGAKLFEFRRGSLTTKIYDLCFDKESNLLACCSANGTVHIFELCNDVEKTKNTTSVLSGVGDYVSYFGSQWGFKQIPLNNTSKMICGFDENGVLHVATYDGKYYRISGNKYGTVTESELYTNAK